MINYQFKSIIFLIVIAIFTGCNQYESKIIYTVSGPININDLGFCLTHEHLMSNFGKDQAEAYYYDEVSLLNQVIPYVRKIKSLGVNSIFDCTTDYFGRRVDLLKKISDSTGIQIITNTGYYGAANDRYVPKFAFEYTAEEIAKIWINEFEKGIDNTEIKPGFIKLAFDEGEPSDIDKKLFIAGILTHLQTGLTMVVHTCNNAAAVETQLQLLNKYGVHPEAWVWVHAHLANDTDMLLNTAAKGAYISLDGVNDLNIEEYIKIITKFKAQNLLNKVLLSHDGDAYPMGSAIRPFEAVITQLIPAMLSNGFTKADIKQIMINNPKNAFAIRVRKLNK